jgi:outer membrane receptor protein involved in Fe transport
VNSKAYSLGARASYTEPIGKSHLLEFAYSYRYRMTTSDKHSYNYNNVTQKYDIIDSAYTNSFENTFINQQFELNIRKVSEKYNYLIGISAQPAFTKSVGDTTSFSRFVVNFSPSAMIEFDFSDTRSLRARYRGNTRQPSITQLQPVPDNSNPLYRPIGNPDLLPEFEQTTSNPNEFYYWFLNEAHAVAALLKFDGSVRIENTEPKLQFRPYR